MDGWRDIPSFEVGRIAGIPVRFDALFPLMVGAILLGFIGRNAPTFAHLIALAAIAVIGATLSILLHELGHAMAARRFGVATDEIRIGGFYGLAILSDVPPTRRAAILILLAGPLMNVAIVVCLWLLLGMPRISDHLYLGVPSLDTLKSPHFIWWDAARSLAYLNIGLAVFNLMPAFPLDGGRMARLLLNGRLGDVRAVSIIGGTGVLIGVWALFGAALYRGLFAAGLFLIFANYAIAKGEVPPPD